MPRLWRDTVEEHRREVRDAILDTAGALADQRGVLALTMSEVAEATGIGRATLYKYFPDVESILVAWHEREVRRHGELLSQLGRSPGGSAQRLEAVLEAYAFIQYDHHKTELATALHRGTHVTHARRHLADLLAGIISEGVETGEVRNDVGADELAAYCLHALSAAATLTTKAAVRRLVAVTVSGLRPVP